MTQICIIAGTYDEALTWAKGQQLCHQCWFFPINEDDLKRRINFHVIVIGSAGHNVPTSYFDRFYSLAQTRGMIGRI